jgi:hypothetical protein
MLPARLRHRRPEPAPDVSSRLIVPITGALDGGSFAGTLQVQRFAPQDGALAAATLVTGLMNTSTGTTSLARTVRLPARVTQAADHSVRVDLGPVCVDVLWWRIDFGHIVVDVAAEPGDVSLELVQQELASAKAEPSRLARVLNGLLDLRG